MAENGVSLNVPIQGDTISPALALIAKRVKDIDPLLDEIGASLETSTQQRFEAATDPEGKPWKRLAAATIAIRGSGAQILRWKGELYDSVTHAVAPGSGVRVGTNRKYARIHQLGGRAGRGHKVEIPARPFLGISAEDQKEIDTLAKDYLGAGAAT